MASRAKHISEATNAALDAYIEFMDIHGLQRNPRLDGLARFAAMLIGKHIGTLPDRLEPASSPTHRGPLHSADVYRLLESAKQNLSTNPEANTITHALGYMAAAAYQSHIELDSRTPMSVPDYRPLVEFMALLAENNRR